MQYIIENWYILFIILAAIVVVAYLVYVFIKRPTTEQITKVQEWLLWACTESERKLGSGTGQIKLRYVYDMFVAKFPHLVTVISFEAFSDLVDEALKKFRVLVETNKNMKSYVEGQTPED